MAASFGMGRWHLEWPSEEYQSQAHTVAGSTTTATLVTGGAVSNNNLQQLTTTTYRSPTSCMTAACRIWPAGTLKPTPLPWLLVLANIEPPALRHKAAVDKLLTKAASHEDWDYMATSQTHQLSDCQPDTHHAATRHHNWREDWESALVVNHFLVGDPAIRQPGFDLPRR